MFRPQGRDAGVDAHGLSGRLLEIFAKAEVPPFPLDEQSGRGKKNRSLGEARYSRAAWTKVASCSMPTALATLRFGSTGSTTISGSGKVRAGGPSNTMTVPGRQERLLSRTPRKLAYFRMRSSQR